MAASASIQITGTVTGSNVGSKTVGPFTITSATAAIDTTRSNLASGDNTLSIVTGATGVILVPPAGNAILVTLRGPTSGGTFPLHKTNPTLLCFDATATAVVLNAAAPVTGYEFTWF